MRQKGTKSDGGSWKIREYDVKVGCFLSLRQLCQKAKSSSIYHNTWSNCSLVNLNFQEVNIQLHKFSTWFNTNKLSLNTKKTNFIIFTPNGKKYNISEAEININGSKIKHVKCTKNLGITIDEHLD